MPHGSPADSLFLGLDLGTGAAKSVLLSESGEILGRGAAPYPIDSPHEGWAESNPDHWWQGCGAAARQAVGEQGKRVAALGVAGQMHGVVLCGRKLTPLRPAVLWADMRSASVLDRFERLGRDAHLRLANPYIPGMCGPTLVWLRDNEPATAARARWALQPKDWLRARLTGEVAGDPSDASATLLFDLSAGAWADDVIDRLAIDRGWLPPIRPSAQVAGRLTASAARHLGVETGIPVATGGGDTPCAAIGTGLLEPGGVQISIGTGAQILAPLSGLTIDPSFRTHTYRAATENGWYAMAAIQNAGLALEWARRVLGLSWEQVYEEAWSVDPGADGVIFLPYLTGERTPHMDPHAFGAWSGLRLYHSRAHLMRAALEGTAFAMRDGLDALAARSITTNALRLVGGGSRDTRWRRLLANVLESPLLAVSEPDASARGAALLAAVAAGRFAGVEDTVSRAPVPVPVAEPDNERELYGQARARFRTLFADIEASPQRQNAKKRDISQLGC